MVSEYLEHRLIKKDAIEYRDYQVNLANQAIKENCLIVLPTGLGKTTVALQVIAEFLSKRTGSVLFLAPTRVLVHQHHVFLKNNLLIDDIAFITGEDPVAKRKKMWSNSVICATPEITKNEIAFYTNLAFKELETLDIDADKKELLKNFGLALMKRTI